MAIKSYRIQQIVNLNGGKVTSTAFISCDTNELDAILALFEGELTVFEEVKKVGSSDTNVTSYNRVSKIMLPCEGGRFLTIKPRVPLIAKNSTDVDKLTSALRVIHPFADFPAVKPTNVIVQMTGGESMAATQP